MSTSDISLFVTGEKLRRERSKQNQKKIITPTLKWPRSDGHPCLPRAKVGVEDDDRLPGGLGEGVPKVSRFLHLGAVISSDVCRRSPKTHADGQTDGQTDRQTNTKPSKLVLFLHQTCSFGHEQKHADARRVSSVLLHQAFAALTVLDVCCLLFFCL